MERQKYSERVKVEKSRQVFPPRSKTEPSYSDIISSKRMDSCSKSEDLSSVPTTSNSCSSDIANGLEDSEHVTRSQKEEKKMAFKLYCKKKKEEAKKAKQREKEEEKLKKIVGPKGESISVIKRDVFHKISSSVSPSTTMQMNNGFSMDSLSFPDIGHGLKRAPRKSAVKVETLTALEVQDKVVEKKEDKPVIQAEASTKTPTKSRKKRDPVVVDILKAIEVCKAEKQPSKKSDLNVAGKKSVQTVSRMAGNILDSSNPLRHRGKKREVPKKRNLTRLKKAIMLEREKRRALRDINKKKNTVSTDPEELKAGNDVILSQKTESDDNKENSGTILESTREVKREQSSPHSITSSSGDMIQEDAPKGTVDVDAMVKEKLHSKKFREYCNHSKRQDLSEAATSMLQDIIRFQDRAHINQPIKAEMHRRYVLGLKQTNNLLCVQKVKIIIMASDIEKVPAPGGLDDIVTTIINSANKQNIPVIFSFQRRQLGKLTYRKVPVSCVAIMNYHGTDTAFQKMSEALEVAKREYQDKFIAEKSRTMIEHGIPFVKLEKTDPEEKYVEPQPDITLPLLKRLAEAISESLQSPDNSDKVKKPLSF